MKPSPPFECGVAKRGATVLRVCRVLLGAGADDVWSETFLAAVQRLPCRHRQAVAYHYLAGFSHAEVAGLIGGTAEAARRAAFDGVRSLRR